MSTPSHYQRRPLALPGLLLTALATVLPAQTQFAELVRNPFPEDGEATRAIAMGDLDGDGDLDLVLGEFNSVRLYQNDGGGGFVDVTAARLPGTFYDVQAVALGDLDLDGDLDLVLGCNPGGRHRVYVYRNDGTGGFTDLTATSMPALFEWPGAMVLGDVDQDGDLDLVLGCGGDLDFALSGTFSQQNRLYLNNGLGIFSDVTATHLPVGSDVTGAVALGDVDGDGDLDLVCGNGSIDGGQQNRLYLNNGVGVFTDATANLPADTDHTTAIALRDFDGDGDLDLYLGNSPSWVQPNFVGGQDRLYRNDGAGTFTDVTGAALPIDAEGAAAVAVADTDGDGDLDVWIASENQDRLYLNDGAGTFTDVSAARLPANTDNSLAVALGDLDGDGAVDAVLGCARVFSPGWTQTMLGLRDRLCRNDGTGSFVDSAEHKLPVDRDTTLAVAAGDVDGDGDLDLVLGNDGQDRLYRNDGAGIYTDATAAALPVDGDLTNAVALADFDGDGDLDLVAGNGGQDRLYLNVSGMFVDLTIALLPIDSDLTSSVAVGDVDGDGDLDLVFGNVGQNRLYLNDGFAGFRDATTALPFDNDDTTSVALADVDGDSDLDVICTTGNVRVFGPTGGQNRLYLNNGAGVFSDGTIQLPAAVTETVGLAVGDVDRDGDVDLVFGDRFANQLCLNDGLGSFVDASSQLAHSSALGMARALALGDVDGDGDLDLAVGYVMDLCACFPSPQPGQERELFLNDGTGRFSTRSLLPGASAETSAMLLADVDGDRDLDLVCANQHFTATGNYFTQTRHSGQNSLLLNLQRHLDAPQPLRAGRPYLLEAYSRTGVAATTDLALPFLSLAPAALPLPPFGTIGIDPSQAVLLPLLVLPQPAGVGSLNLAIPNLPAYVGISLYSQALIVSPAQGKLSNVVHDVLR